jgi:hypothetical protein
MKLSLHTLSLLPLLLLFFLFVSFTPKEGEKKPPTPKETTRDRNNTFPQTNKKKRELLSSPLPSSQGQKTTKEYLNTNPTTKAAEKSHCNDPNHHNSSIIHKNLKE